MKNLKTEFQKLRRRYIWFFFAARSGHYHSVDHLYDL